jgi:5-aminolevulinate synthase
LFSCGIPSASSRARRRATWRFCMSRSQLDSFRWRIEAVAAAATAANRHHTETSVARHPQKRQVARLRARLDAEGIPHENNPSHIIPVMVKDPVKCRMLSDILMEQFGIYVQPINYPTVPKGTERLRFTPGPLHTDEDIEYLVLALKTLWKQCAIAHAVA